MNTDAALKDSGISGIGTVLSPLDSMLTASRDEHSRHCPQQESPQRFSAVHIDEDERYI
jgi:hypothetical protein